MENATNREKDIDITISNELFHDDKQYLNEFHKYDEELESSNYFQNYKMTVYVIEGLFIVMIVLIIIFKKWFIILIGLPIIIGLPFTFLPNVIMDDDYVRNNRIRWYYLDPDTCLLSIGWKVIDNKYYYFATETIDADYVYDKISGSFVPNGKDKILGQMYCDEYTPDGRYVNSQGAMVNQYR